MLLLTANYADGAIRQRSRGMGPQRDDMLAMLRGFVKYDEQPGSLQHFAESARASTWSGDDAPYGPVALVLDQYLQEATISGTRR